ncbi:MAG: hypothetical protein GKR90_25540 [Pseudomonadales bacterium]|nr:hypothetical protein [Pseudomonadales bacterium]
MDEIDAWVAEVEHYKNAVDSAMGDLPTRGHRVHNMETHQVDYDGHELAALAPYLPPL